MAKEQTTTTFYYNIALPSFKYQHCRSQGNGSRRILSRKHISSLFLYFISLQSANSKKDFFERLHFARFNRVSQVFFKRNLAESGDVWRKFIRELIIYQ